MHTTGFLSIFHKISGILLQIYSETFFVFYNNINNRGIEMYDKQNHKINKFLIQYVNFIYWFCKWNSQIRRRFLFTQQSRSFKRFTAFLYFILYCLCFIYVLFFRFEDVGQLKSEEPVGKSMGTRQQIKIMRKSACTLNYYPFILFNLKTIKQ